MAKKLFSLSLKIPGCSNSYRYKYFKSENARECVVCLHGLRSSSHVWKKLQKLLAAKGYNVLLVNYPSSKFPVEKLAKEAVGSAIFQCRKEKNKKIHFVAHSLGSVLVRYYLQENNLPELGRVVMLSPPNNGSELVDRFFNVPIFRSINGPAGMQLGADERGFVKNLEIPDYEFAVLAGSRSINWIESCFIPGRDDGRVSVESAKLENMRDFKIIKTNHHFIPFKKETIGLTVNFIKHGTFDFNNNF